MDPFSAEGGKQAQTRPTTPTYQAQQPTDSPSNPELINIHNAFHQGQYQVVLDFDTTNLSPENHLPARVLQYRAKIALGQPDQALSDIEADSDAGKPDLAAVKALAQLVAGNAEGAEMLALELVEKEGEGNMSVQVCGGIVLQGVGRSEEALGILSKHQGSLEAYVISPPPRLTLMLRGIHVNITCSVALIVQIHLQQNRSDLAVKEVQAAKRWAQDSLLVNLAESWVGLRVVRLPSFSFFYLVARLTDV